MFFAFLLLVLFLVFQCVGPRCPTDGLLYVFVYLIVVLLTGLLCNHGTSWAMKKLRQAQRAGRRRQPVIPKPRQTASGRTLNELKNLVQTVGRAVTQQKIWSDEEIEKQWERARELATKAYQQAQNEQQSDKQIRTIDRQLDTLDQHTEKLRTRREEEKQKTFKIFDNIRKQLQKALQQKHFIERRKKEILGGRPEEETDPALLADLNRPLEEQEKKIKALFGKIETLIQSLKNKPWAEPLVQGLQQELGYLKRQTKREEEIEIEVEKKVVEAEIEERRKRPRRRPEGRPEVPLKPVGPAQDDETTILSIHSYLGAELKKVQEGNLTLPTDKLAQLVQQAEKSADRTQTGATKKALQRVKAIVRQLEKAANDLIATTQQNAQKARIAFETGTMQKDAFDDLTITLTRSIEKGAPEEAHKIRSEARRIQAIKSGRDDEKALQAQIQDEVVKLYQKIRKTVSIEDLRRAHGDTLDFIYANFTGEQQLIELAKLKNLYADQKRKMKLTGQTEREEEEEIQERLQRRPRKRAAEERPEVRLKPFESAQDDELQIQLIYSRIDNELDSIKKGTLTMPLDELDKLIEQAKEYATRTQNAVTAQSLQYIHETAEKLREKGQKLFTRNRKLIDETLDDFDEGRIRDSKRFLQRIDFLTRSFEQIIPDEVERIKSDARERVEDKRRGQEEEAEAKITRLPRLYETIKTTDNTKIFMRAYRNAQWFIQQNITGEQQGIELEKLENLYNEKKKFLDTKERLQKQRIRTQAVQKITRRRKKDLTPRQKLQLLYTRIKEASQLRSIRTRYQLAKKFIIMNVAGDKQITELNKLEKVFFKSKRRLLVVYKNEWIDLHKQARAVKATTLPPPLERKIVELIEKVQKLSERGAEQIQAEYDRIKKTLQARAGKEEKTEEERIAELKRTKEHQHTQALHEALDQPFNEAVSAQDLAKAYKDALEYINKNLTGEQQARELKSLENKKVNSPERLIYKYEQEQWPTLHKQAQAVKNNPSATQLPDALEKNIIQLITRLEDLKSENTPQIRAEYDDIKKTLQARAQEIKAQREEMNLQIVEKMAQMKRAQTATELRNLYQEWLTLIDQSMSQQEKEKLKKEIRQRILKPLYLNTYKPQWDKLMLNFTNPFTEPEEREETKAQLELILEQITILNPTIGARHKKDLDEAMVR